MLETFPLNVVARRLANESHPELEILEAIQKRGLLVCEPSSTTPVTKTERYYYLQTARAKGFQQDGSDIRNRYALSLRGERDMLAFIRAGKGRLVHPDSSQADFVGLQDWQANLDYVFSSALPPSPGIYSEGFFF